MVALGTKLLLFAGMGIMAAATISAELLSYLGNLTFWRGGLFTAHFVAFVFGYGVSFVPTLWAYLADEMSQAGFFILFLQRSVYAVLANVGFTMIRENGGLDEERVTLGVIGLAVVLVRCKSGTRGRAWCWLGSVCTVAAKKRATSRPPS